MVDMQTSIRCLVLRVFLVLIVLIPVTRSSLAASPMPTCQDGGRREATRLFQRLVEQYESVTSSHFRYETVRLEKLGPVRVEVVEGFTDELRLRVDFAGINSSAQTIVNCKDIESVRIGSLYGPKGALSGKLEQVGASFCVGNRALDENIWSTVTSPAHIAVLGGSRAFDGMFLAIDQPAWKSVLNQISFERASQNVALEWKVVDGNVRDQSCKVIQCTVADRPGDFWKYHVAEQPLRVLRQETMEGGKHWISDTLEWFAPNDPDSLPFPKVKEWYTLVDGAKQDHHLMTIELMEVNVPVEPERFELRGLKGLVAGQGVAYKDDRPYPCPSSQGLVWDGSKLVCGSLEGEAAVFRSIARPRFFKSVAVWCASFGIVAAVWVAVGMIRKKVRAS